MSILKLESDVTRVDLERVGSNVLIKKWYGRWSEGSAPAVMDFAVDARIETLLADCENVYGMAVEMCDGGNGRALRGEITRIDFIHEGGQWVVKKFPYGWTARTRPIATKTMSDEEALTQIQYYKEGRWKVREFPGGARAWKYEVKPVRDASEIRHMRRKVTDAMWRGESENKGRFDLAFDC